MANKGILTKSLAVAGTLLVWLPIAAPLVLSAGTFIGERAFRLDYLMPAELFPAALVGGALLLWAAVRAQSDSRLIAWGLAIAAGMLFGGQGFAMITGMAFGQGTPATWWLAILIGTLVIYTVAVVAMGVGGVRLLRGLFGPPRSSAERR